MTFRRDSGSMYILAWPFDARALCILWLRIFGIVLVRRFLSMGMPPFSSLAMSIAASDSSWRNLSAPLAPLSFVSSSFAPELMTQRSP